MQFIALGKFLDFLFLSSVILISHQHWSFLFSSLSFSSLLKLLTPSAHEALIFSSPPPFLLPLQSCLCRSTLQVLDHKTSEPP